MQFANATMTRVRVINAPVLSRCVVFELHGVLRAILLASASAAAPIRAADVTKTLRVAFSIAETTFDPAFASDAASDGIIANIFDTMLDYDYLARPVKLVPRALEAMPTVEDGGRTYLCKVRKGIYFTPDPAFKGEPRELTAADFAYGAQARPRPGREVAVALAAGRQDAGRRTSARERAAKTGRFDYDAPIAGLEVVDRYTLRIRLNAPDLRFPYVLAVPNIAAQSRARWSRRTAATSARIRSAPVRTCSASTGAARASCWSRIPAFRDMTLRAGRADTRDVAAGRRGAEGHASCRCVGRVEISVIEEGQARWLAFLNRELDFLEHPARRVHRAGARRDGKLRPELAAKGIAHDVLLRPNTWWIYFNMEDPVVGGYTPEKIALRRAIAMGYDDDRSDPRAAARAARRRRTARFRPTSRATIRS